MANYLLLRDNKESGPYSLDELLKLGLKAYDLVWIQNKSAAWRYPSEVEELKTFAPAIEEQPFDRFFKKNFEEKTNTVQEEKHEVASSAKTVFVKTPSPKIELAKTEIIVPPLPEKTYQRVKTITVTESPVNAETKFAQPLEEIKEMYVKSLQERKSKAARKSQVIKTIKRTSVFLYVLALGVLIGLTLYPKVFKKNIAQQQPGDLQSSSTLQTISPVPGSDLPVQQEPASNELQQEPLKPSTNQTKEVPSKPISQKAIVFSKKANSPNVNDKKGIDSDQNIPAADINTQTGERTRSTRGEANTTSVSKEEISKLVSVKSNNYKRGAFGGIHDLQLTVTNDSKYILDNVVVELEYLKPNEKPLKTDNISFHSIAPQGSLTIAIPSSNRGIKVNYKIVKIESKDLN